VDKREIEISHGKLSQQWWGSRRTYRGARYFIAEDGTRWRQSRWAVLVSSEKRGFQQIERMPSSRNKKTLNPPKTRNEKMAALMRRMQIGEEAGTGWDKIVSSCESQQLPAPKMLLYPENTIVKLYPATPFSGMSREDRLRACYQHAVLKYVQDDPMSNSSLRERLGLEPTMMSKVSRIIKEAIEAGLIRKLEPDTAPKLMRYIPVWA